MRIDKRLREKRREILEVAKRHGLSPFVGRCCAQC